MELGVRVNKAESMKDDEMSYGRSTSTKDVSEESTFL